VTEVIVVGNQRRSTDEIMEGAGIQKGNNVLSLDLERARHKLLGDPWIREATFSRRLPGTVHIRVVEREAAGLVAMGLTYLTTRQGDIFKRLDPGDPTDLPIVTGISIGAVAEDREGAARSIRRALDLADEYEHSHLAERSPLQEVHVAADGTIALVVGKSGVALQLGEPPFRRKLDQAARVFVELDRRGAKADAIMLDNDARPERVVVRMR